MTEPAYELLAVDDNELNLGLFRLFLTQLGHNVTSASNAFDAIDLVNARHFDMVFTDIQMPGMSGIEAAARMRQDGFKGPIIAITAHLSNLEETELTASNINGYLIKPVTKKDLVQVLAVQLGGDHADASATTLLEAQHESARMTNGSTTASADDRSATPALKSEEDSNTAASFENHDTEKTGPLTYDLEVALTRANQSPTLATEMLHMLAKSLNESLAELETNDREALSQALHKLAGGVRYSGATSLETAVENARRGLLEDSAADLRAVSAEIQSVLDWAADNPAPFTA